MFSVQPVQVRQRQPAPVLAPVLRQLVLLRQLVPARVHQLAQRGNYDKV